MVLRGIIIEIKDKYSIVMKDNGSMVRVRNKEGLKVGDAILFLEEDIYGKNNILNFADFKVWKPMIAVAACLMLVLLFAYNRNSYTDYALLSMDVNPSIQFKLDKDGNIVDILGLNNDGEKILDKHLLGKSLEEGLSKLKLLMEEKNYLKDDSPILVGFAYLEDINDDEYEENVKSLLKKIYSKNEILYLKSNSLRANESLKRKLSVGRLEALESIADENIKTNIESISVEEIKENISKSNRTEIFNDDYMDEDDEDDEDDDYDEIDDDWDHENSDNDHEDRLEDKIDKKNNNTDNDETDDENEYEEEDSSVNTNTFTNKESKYDNIEGNKSNDDYEDEIDNKGNDYNDEQKEENKEEDDDNDENGYNNSDINTDDKSKNNSQNHKESENENINESNHEEKEDNNTEAYNEKDSNRNSLSNDSKNNSSDNIESSSNADNSSDNDSND